jgi:hypothetical protein
MLYLANPSTRAIRDRVADLSVVAIMTPRQGNELPAAGWPPRQPGSGRRRLRAPAAGIAAPGRRGNPQDDRPPAHGAVPVIVAQVVKVLGKAHTRYVRPDLRGL